MSAPDYSERCECVEAPALAFIKHTPTGRLVDVKTRLSRMTWYKAMIWRRLIINDRHSQFPKYVCPICKSALYLLSSRKHKLYFQHMPSGISCPVKEKGRHSREEIRALIYGQRKESLKHRELINLICKSIEADRAFAPPEIEPTITDENDSTKHRYPDLLTRTGSRTLVFEAQVSSTFLDVIDARQAFYARNNIELFWILPSFDNTSRRIAEDDIVAQHGGFAIVANSETLDASVKNQKLMFELHQYSPETTNWLKQLLPFAKLISPAREIISKQSECEKEKSKKTDFEKNKEALIYLCSEYAGLFDLAGDKVKLDGLEIFLNSEGVFYPQRVHPDIYFSKFSDFGIELSLKRMVRIIETAKTGQQVGYMFSEKPFLQIANLLYDKDPFALTVFGMLLRKFEQTHALNELENSPKWKTKVPEIRRNWKKYRRASKLSEFDRAVLDLFYSELGPMYGKTKWEVLEY